MKFVSPACPQTSLLVNLRPLVSQYCRYYSYLVGEPAGTRTQDNLIKSQVLYHLSYGLLRRVCRGASRAGQ